MSLLAVLKAVHPKVAATGLSALAATIIVALLSAAGHAPDPDTSAAITAVVAFVAGWLKPHNAVVEQSGDAQDDGLDAA
jgi:hypothetical protein